MSRRTESVADYWISERSLGLRSTLSSYGYTADRIALDYRSRAGNRTSIGAVAFTTPAKDPSEAAIVVHGVERARPPAAFIRNLCLGVAAPFALVHHLDTDMVDVWGVGSGRAGILQPVRANPEPIAIGNVSRALKEYAPDFLPETICAVKAGRARFSHDAFRKLDALQLNLLAEKVDERSIVRFFSHAVGALAKSCDRERAGEIALQMLAWRVLAAKKGLLKDAEPHQVVARSVRAGLTGYFDWTGAEVDSEGFQEALKVMKGLDYSAFQLDMLRSIYRKAFDPAVMRELGQFDTPLWLSRLILQSLPLEFLPPEKRVVVDMTCGWGSFLVAANERLTAMPDMPKASALTKHIRGNEIAPLISKLARMALLLSSGHNSWSVDAGDALEWRGSRPGTADVIVGNPPFRTEKGKESRKDDAFSFLKRALDALKPGGLLGLIMPASFEVKEAAGVHRKRMLEELELMELWRLPADVFSGVSGRVSVLIARKASTARRSLPLVFRETASHSVGAANLRRGVFDNVSLVEDPARWLDNRRSSRSHSIAVFEPFGILSERKWKDLAARRLADVAWIVYGMPKGTKRREHDPNFKRRTVSYQQKSKGVIEPFRVAPKGLRNIVYPDDLAEPGLIGQGGKPAKYAIMEGPKVILPGTMRMDWGRMLKAAVDRSGMYVSGNFYTVTPKPDAVKEGIDVDVLAAILNSNVANAWIGEHRQFPQVNSEVLEDMPFPGARSPSSWNALRKASQRLSELGSATEEDLDDLSRLAAAEYGLTREDQQRLRRVAVDSSVAGPIRVTNLPRADEQVPVLGHVVSVDAPAAEMTVWLDVAYGNARLPIDAAVPGWLLSPDVRFSALCREERPGVFELDQFQPSPLAYLTHEEIEARVQARMDRSSRT